ncbi:MAG TPA: restriction endonuclease subunit M [Prolixibacteraceae bacterium]|nr:restriction endonuclease subunit M [Prolixibacteraceae bacterium]
MSLFQKTVERKYLKQLDSKLIAAKYDEFKSYFGNPEIQKNIRNSKEEQFQEGFLRELFVKILGYTLNPDLNFNLTTEYKNIKDSKKADGAIIIGESVKGVIELKGTNTTDLGKIEAQAFGYKNNQPDCVYIITSNFEKLRFYIDNAVEFIEFNLFKLTKSDFEILFICLAYDQIAKGIPKKVKEESVSHEDVITKKLYSDYSLFKRELHQNLVSQNPQFDALTLFRKSQKLLDRFLFLFFAEDRQLLPPNSVRLVLNDWKELQERDAEVPLYDRFKKYFGYLNTGFKGKRYDVFAYNGGLFEPDEVLDSVVIDDNLLYKNALKLSEYDFISEVDVNILGHIFENSLNELDEIQAQLDGKEIDKAKTKRKKDGVFYTPKYITKYIVENTLGKLCSEKKAELQFNEEDYTTDKKRQIKTKQALLDKLKTYQNWLLQLTICDPACGSGAFLNQALDFLIAEHRYIDELQAKLLGVPMILSDVEKSILENNLFGVDLNEESVEIAKLSLWLRTAQPNRKLNDLSNNIKCGNSIISDPAVAGDKAFNWEREFPQVFGPEKRIPLTIEPRKDATPDYLKLIKEKSLEAQVKAEQAIALSKEAAEISKKVYEYAERLEEVSELDSVYVYRKTGFDVVIGNPPYVDIKALPKNIVEHISTTYKTANNRINLFSVFIEKAGNILKDGGKFSFIIPSSLLTQESYKPLRKQLLSESHIDNIVRLPNESFGGSAGEVKVDTIIFTFTKTTNLKSPVEVLVYKGFTRINEITILNCDELSYMDLTLWERDADYIFRININAEISDLMSKIEGGTTVLLNCADFCLGLTPYDKYKGHTPEQINNRVFHSLFKKDETFRKLLAGHDVTRYSIKWNGQEWISYGKWLGAPREERFFTEKRILVKQIIDWTAKRIWASITNDELYNAQNAFNLIAHENYYTEYLLILINSQLISFYHRKKFLEEYKDRFQKILIKDCKNFPIKAISKEKQQPFIEKADLMLSLTKELQDSSQKFQRTILRKFDLEDLPGKLQNWYLLSYKEFIAELGKKKVKLSLKEEAKWEDYFLQEAEKALEIKAAIETTDKEIDLMVYQLYELTDEEIRIVEGA